MSIHDINQKYADSKGATMLRGFDGYDNYFLLGTFPEFGARLAMRARNSTSKKGTKISFKLRLMPVEGAEYGNWDKACPSIQWAGYTLDSNERRSACFGIGLAAWTRAEIKQAIEDVDYPQVLDNWLTALGLTWDAKQRELLPAYLAEAADALFADDHGEGVVVDVDDRVAHAARHIVPEEQIYYSEDDAPALFIEGPDPDDGDEDDMIEDPEEEDF